MKSGVPETLGEFRILSRGDALVAELWFEACERFLRRGAGEGAGKPTHPAQRQVRNTIFEEWKKRAV